MTSDTTMKDIIVRKGGGKSSSFGDKIGTLTCLPLNLKEGSKLLLVPCTLCNIVVSA